MFIVFIVLFVFVFCIGEALGVEPLLLFNGCWKQTMSRSLDTKQAEMLDVFRMDMMKSFIYRKVHWSRSSTIISTLEPYHFVRCQPLHVVQIHSSISISRARIADKGISSLAKR